MKINKKEVLVLVPILIYYFYEILFLAHYNFTFNDPGYLFGMAWRLLNGEEIYVDFLYARPPLSPYLVAFWINILPEDGQYYYTKIVVYTYSLTTSLMLFYILKRHMKSFFSNAHSGSILLMINVFNVNYYNHFWHTIDGILFSTASLFVGLSKETPSTIRIYGMSILILFAMLSKQSFYPMPFAIALFLALIYTKKVAIRFAAIMFLNVIIMLTLAYVFAKPQFVAYLEFKQYNSQLGPLLEAGVVNYVIGGLRLFVFMGFFVVLIYNREFYALFKKKEYSNICKQFITPLSHGFILLVGLLAALNLYDLANEPDGSSMLMHIPVIGGLSIYIVWMLFQIERNIISMETKKQILIIGLLMSIAWCASLSWGYKSPMLYSGIIMFSFLYVYWVNTKKHVSRITILFTTLMMAILSLVFVMQGFTDKSENLGKYAKKLNGTYVHHRNSIRNISFIEEEIKKCNSDNYVVLPSHPHIHWMHNTTSKISLDWVSNVEMLNKKERIKEELKSVDCIIIDKYYSLGGNKEFDFNRSELIGSERYKHIIKRGGEESNN